MHTIEGALSNMQGDCEWIWAFHLHCCQLCGAEPHTFASWPFNSLTRPRTILPNQKTFKANNRGGTVRMRTITSVLKSLISGWCSHICLKNQRNRIIRANSQVAKRHTPLTVYIHADRHPCIENRDMSSSTVSGHIWCQAVGQALLMASRQT